MSHSLRWQKHLINIHEEFKLLSKLQSHILIQFKHLYFILYIIAYDSWKDISFSGYLKWRSKEMNKMINARGKIHRF